MSGWWVVLIVVGCVVAFVALSMFMDAVDHPAQRCSHCGKKFGADHIPPEIRQAARAAGLSDPLWYVGRTYCPNYKRQKTLGDVVRDTHERENQ